MYIHKHELHKTHTHTPCSSQPKTVLTFQHLYCIKGQFRSPEAGKSNQYADPIQLTVPNTRSHGLPYLVAMLWLYLILTSGR